MKSRYISRIITLDPGVSRVITLWGFQQPYKFEWATVKDGELIMGSIGKDWVSDTGSILHKNPEWVKIMDASGRIRSENWGFGFDRLREVTNTTTPGYLWHEAVEWDPVHRVWAFLPRKENLKANNLVYNPEADETLGTNLLLMVSEDFRDVQVGYSCCCCDCSRDHSSLGFLRSIVWVIGSRNSDFQR
jgi:Apyrase